MKNIDIQVRDKKEFCKCGQLYANLNKKNDIHINVSVTLGKVLGNVKRIRIRASLCNKDGNILYV